MTFGRMKYNVYSMTLCNIVFYCNIVGPPEVCDRELVCKVGDRAWVGVPKFARIGSALINPHTSWHATSSKPLKSILPLRIRFCEIDEKPNNRMI